MHITEKIIVKYTGLALASTGIILMLLERQYSERSLLIVIIGIVYSASPYSRNFIFFC